MVRRCRRAREREPLASSSAWLRSTIDASLGGAGGSVRGGAWAQAAPAMAIVRAMRMAATIARRARIFPPAQVAVGGRPAVGVLDPNDGAAAATGTRSGRAGHGTRRLASQLRSRFSISAGLNWHSA